LKRAIFILVVVAVLIGGGLLTLIINEQGTATIPGIRLQTRNPEASVVEVTPEKGALFFIWTGIVLSSVIGFGVTLAVISWFLNRQVERFKQRPNQELAFTLNPARPNSIGAVIAKSPRITIAIIVTLIVFVAAFAALALGVFTAR
jgi:hypothetical protein